MAFSLTPMYHNNWWRPFQSDMRLMRNVMDTSDPDHPPTLEPSYSYEVTDERAQFEIELPGVAKDDVTVEVDGHKLIVRGKRFKKLTQQTNAEGERKPSLVYLLEARLGHASDLDKVKADCVGDGILMVEVPTKTAQGTRKIQIGVE